ncbi:MAG: phosphohistidine phosphatase SixA [Methanomicrobiales archaeon]|nr:phosphohistidine phosphatase SixA [Methanomicrobiales archaeon]
MELFILRHGKAGKREENPREDRIRPLTPKGKKEIREIARWMLNMHIELDWIATSPIERSRETAEIVAQVLRFQGRTEEWDALKIDQDPKDVLEQLSRKDSGSQGLMVGHEPMLSRTTSLLVSSTDSARIILAKGGLAKIGNITLHPAPEGELEWLILPEILMVN